MIGDMVGVKSPIGRAVVMVPLYVDETLRGYEPAGVHRDGEGVRVAHRPGLGGQEQRGGAEVGQHPPYPMYIASSEYINSTHNTCVHAYYGCTSGCHSADGIGQVHMST